MNRLQRYARLTAIGVVATVLLGAASDAQAQGCTVSTSPVNFGFYAPDGDANGFGTIDVQCSGGESPMVQIDAGAHSDGVFDPRRMQSAAGDQLEYNLYLDDGYGSIWGDGTNGTSAPSGPGTFTVYGKIPSTQTAPPGQYADTVIIQVLW